MIKKAFELFDKMDEENIKIDLFTFAALLSSCAKTGQGELVGDLLKKMKRFKNLKMNNILLTTSMIAFVKSNQSNIAIELFQNYKYNSNNCNNLDIGCYIAALSACTDKNSNNKNNIEISKGNDNNNENITSTINTFVIPCKIKLVLELYTEMIDKGIYKQLNRNGYKYLLNVLYVDISNHNINNYDVIKRICQDATDKGMIPTIDKNKNILNLITVKSEISLCLITIWFTLQSILTNNNIEVSDLMVIIGNVPDEIMTEIQLGVHNMYPNQILKTRNITNNKNVFIVTKTSIKAWKSYVCQNNI
jgi:pentatricopeptide repeat protein